MTIDNLNRIPGLHVYPASVSEAGGTTYFLCKRGNEKLLGCVGSPCVEGAARLGEIAGRCVCARPLDAAGAEAVRKALPWTAPRCIGRSTSAGFGDRLGLATPAHVRAVRGTGITPVFAQQSVREMTRTARTPQEVIDAATWGVLQEGFRDGFGADADHVHNPDDLAPAVKAGFTMFTIDPGQHVRAVERMDAAELARLFADESAKALESSADDLRRRYAGKRFALDGGGAIELDESSLMRAAVKYGRAVGHVAMMYRQLVTTTWHGHPAHVSQGRLAPASVASSDAAPSGKEATHGRDARGTHGRDGHATSEPFELEVSVDETESPTSPEEHYFIAAELSRLGVKWVSLAPRFPGRFEKGIEYIGDLAEFRRSFALHVAVMRTLGPYKLSVHSGSDKFALYPIIAELAGGLVHLKTAGTSYVEALRSAAAIEPDLFRLILSFAMGRYERDRASYLVSAELAKVPPPASVPNADLPALLDDRHVRQVLHVTFGSVFQAGGGAEFLAPLRAALMRDEETFYGLLRKHMERHLRPFAGHGAD
jgi:hypothetical protein